MSRHEMIACIVICMAVMVYLLGLLYMCLKYYAEARKVERRLLAEIRKEQDRTDAYLRELEELAEKSKTLQ